MVFVLAEKEKELIQKIGKEFPLDSTFLSYVESTYTDLPYHNFLHALQVTHQAIVLATKAKKYGVESNLRILVPSGLFHDSYYHKPIQNIRYPTKEALAAHTAVRYASVFGMNGQSFSQEELDGIVLTILATEHDKTPKTSEEKILRASDLVGLAGPYDTFFDNAVRLRQEERQLYGKTYTNSGWVDHVRQVIEQYLSQDIRLTPEHDDAAGFSVFHRKTRENLETYISAMGQ